MSARSRLMIFPLISSLAVWLFPFIASAHEVYVLNKLTVLAGLATTTGLNFTQILSSGDNLTTFIVVVAGVLVALAIFFWLQETRLGRGLDRLWSKPAKYGPAILRLTIATSFFFSALTKSFLGPELSLSTFPAGGWLRLILFIISLGLFIGWQTEWLALGGLTVYLSSFFLFGFYPLTYLNYFGELLVLAWFGSRIWSLDQSRPVKRWFSKFWSRYESLIVRLGYGLALVYAAVNIKIIHSLLTLDVVNDYHLTQFHWLFPADPHLVVLGAAVAEIAIGLFIIFGFQLRLTVLITLFYITLSLVFFREAVWPHLLLYGLSLNLLFNPGVYTLDHWFHGGRKEKSN